MKGKHYALSVVLFLILFPATKYAGVEPFIASVQLKFTASYVIFPALLLAMLYLGFAVKWERLGDRTSFDAIVGSSGPRKMTVVYKFVFILLSLTFMSGALSWALLLYAAWPHKLLAIEPFKKVVRIVSIDVKSAQLLKNYIYVTALDSDTDREITFFWPKNQESEFLLNPSSFAVPTRCLSGRKSGLGLTVEEIALVCNS
jgi:hypothetical protein